MNKYSSSLTISLAVALVGLAVLPLRAQYGQPAIDAKEIPAAEAAKNYPPPKGGYPAGELTAAGGFIKSPYPPHRVFHTHSYGKDGKEVVIQRGALILDPYAKHLFVNP
jgi:hypothetical protein